MELIERPNLKAVKFLYSITYKQFKTACLNEAEMNGEKKPKETDMKTWYYILQQFCKTNIKTKGITKRIYSYSQNTPAGLGGRLFSGGSMQGIWNVYRGLLMNGIGTDIDMVNCHPVLLLYICNKHGIPCPQLEYYVKNRDVCLSAFPSRAVGKNAYLVATNNDKLTQGKDLPTQFKAYDREMKTIQKQLVELPDYKDLQETISEYKLSHNYNGSVINRILCYYENIVLQHALHVVNSKGIEVAILMFDGFMVYGDYYNDLDLLKEIETYVEQQMTGLNMKWSYKPHNQSLKIPDDFDEDADVKCAYRFVQDDNSASSLIYAELKGDLYFINQRLFMKHKNIWIEDLQFISDFILDYILKSNICKTNDDKVYVPYNQNVKSAKNVREALLVKIRTSDANNDEIYNKFHTTTRNRICFLDGVLDFKEKRFYKWDEIKFEYYSTVQIKRNYGDYFKNPNFETINHIKNEIYAPLYGNDLNLALKFLARAITGNKEDKNWGMYNGNRNSGKGVQYGTLVNAFEGYVKSFDLGNLLFERSINTEEVGRKLYWLLDHEFTRLAVSQEIPDPSTHLKVNAGLFKKIMSGGDTQTARRNYDRTDTNFIVDMTIFMLGNHELKVNENDMYEQCVSFTSVNQFKTQAQIDKMREDGVSELVLQAYKIKDDTIKDKVLTDEWKNAIVYLLYQNYTEHAVVPNYLSENIEDEDILPLRQSILEKYVITNNKNDYILCDVVYSALRGEKKKVDLELKSFGVEKKKSCKGNDTRNKMCFWGITKIDEEPDEEPEVIKTIDIEFDEV